MLERAAFFLLVLSIFPAASPAQQSGSKNPPTDVQKQGHRIFEQRCSICHTKPTITSRQYGPTLSKDIVDGNEDMVRDIISNGVPGKMPGFKYGMKSSEIDAIIEYLKTAPKPSPDGAGPKVNPAN